MALKIWMPFVNNTENQGLCSTATLQKTVDAYTAQTDGKLGGAYSGYSLYHASKEFLGNQWSVAAWVNAVSFGQYNNIIFCKNISSSTDCHIYWSVISNNTYNIGVNGPSGTTTYSYTFATNTWYHLATTYDGSRIKMYINGGLVKDVAYASTQPTGCLNFGLGARSSNAAGTSAAAAGNWKFNDFRLYDTAISAKEVEELARGLVLHYKLSDTYVEGTTNLCSTSASGWNNSGTCVRTANDTAILYPPTKSNTYSIRATSDGSMAAQIGLTPASHPSKTIVASTWVWLDGTQDSSSFYLRSVKTDGSVGYLRYRGQSNPTLWPQRQWIRIATDPITTAADATTFYICTYVNKNTEVRAFNGWQIEAKDHPTAWTPPDTTRAFNNRVCDCSGYKHHGTLNDTSIVISTDTARYTSSLKNNQAYNSGTYPLSGPLVLNNINQITISLWARPTTMGHQDSGIFSTTAASLPTDYQTTVCNHYDGYLACCNTSGTVVRLTVGGQFTLNEWHLYTFTYDGANVRFYKDGVLKTSAAQSGKLKPITQIFPFYSKAGGANRTTSGCLSDVRVYVTALSDKQVLELYNESAAIDRSGTYYTRELIEQ